MSDRPDGHRHTMEETLYGTPNADSVRVEWAELWPDGKVRPVHLNATPVGQPRHPTPYAHRGTVWVRRTVVYGPWEQIDGSGSDA